MTPLRLLSGPDLKLGPEAFGEHLGRFGSLPAAGRGLIETLERSGLTGRGGASFPVGAKWRSVAARSRGSAVVIANGAEGEPQSHKDRLLMATRPHLVLDGAFLAAEALGARDVVLYIGEEHQAARVAMATALARRPEPERRLARMVEAPRRYVAGESSAAGHLVEGRGAT